MTPNRSSVDEAREVLLGALQAAASRHALTLAQLYRKDELSTESIVDIVRADVAAASVDIMFAPPVRECSILPPRAHLGPWEHVPRSDSLERCTACGYVSGK